MNETNNKMIKVRKYNRKDMPKIKGIIFLFLFIAVILATGCTSTGSTNAAPVATPTAQVIYVTVLVTPTVTQPETIAATLTTAVTSRGHSLGSVAGAWAYNDDIKIQINSDGTTLDNIEDSWSTGTWRFVRENVFSVSAGSMSGEWVYDEVNNTIYQIKQPQRIYHVYTGTIKKFCPSDPTLTYNKCMEILSHASYAP